MKTTATTILIATLVMLVMAFLVVGISQAYDREMRVYCFSLEKQAQEFKEVFWVTELDYNECAYYGIKVNARIGNK